MTLARPGRCGSGPGGCCSPAPMTRRVRRRPTSSCGRGRLGDPVGPNQRWVLLAAIDEMPTNDPPPPRTIRGRVLEHVHGAVDVQVDGASPRLGVHLGDRADGQRAARAVHRAVQPAVPRRRRIDSAGDLVLVGDVGGLVADRAALALTASISSTAAASRSALRPTIITEAPEATRPAATPLPIPLPPPVTR